MKNRLIAIVVIVLVIVGLFATAKVRKPKPPQPTTQEIQAIDGIPVTTAKITTGAMEQTVEVTGDINALDKVTLSSKIQGRVAKVFAREGDSVSRGQTIVLLDQQDALSSVKQAEAGLRAAKIRLSQAKTTSDVTKIQSDASIEQAKASLTAAQAKLEIVKKPARSQEEMVAENALNAAKANLDNAEANYKRNQSLLKQGAISQAAFDTVKAQYAVAQAEHKSAKDRLDLVREGGRTEDIQAAEAQVSMAREQLRTAKANASQILLRKEDIKQAQAAVEQAEAALALAKQQLSYTYIKSPISGKLASRLIDPGQVVGPGQAMGDVVNLGSLYFKGDISERNIANVKQGQNVNVKIDAIPGKSFSGSVIDIYPSGSTLSRNFPVRIGINTYDGIIKPAMFARGQIITGYTRDALLVPKDAVDVRKGSNIVFTLQSRTVKESDTTKTIYVAKRHDIEVANENREYVQVKLPTDLMAGDQVITQGKQNLQDGVKIQLINGR